MDPDTKKKLAKEGRIVLLLIYFFPIGIYAMWKHTDWNKHFKIAISIILTLSAIICVVSYQNKNDDTGIIITTETTTVSTTVKSEQRTVYITPQGERYHRKSTCGGKNSYSVTIDNVGDRTACQKCW